MKIFDIGYTKGEWILMLKALKRLLELDGEFDEKIEAEMDIEKIKVQITDSDAQRIELDIQIIERIELFAAQREEKVKEAVLRQHDEITEVYGKLDDSSTDACLQRQREARSYN